MWWSTRLFLIDLFPPLCFRLVLVRAGHGDLWSFILGGFSDILLTAFCVLATSPLLARGRSRTAGLALTLSWWLYHALVAALAAGDVVGGEKGLKAALRRSLQVTGHWTPGPRPDLGKIPFANREDRA